MMSDPVLGGADLSLQHGRTCTRLAFLLTGTFVKAYATPDPSPRLRWPLSFLPARLLRAERHQAHARLAAAPPRASLRCAVVVAKIGS